MNANQTHDQIGNRALGERLIELAGPEPMRIAHAVLLCAPYIPMLFQGEEEGSRARFPFFCDYEGDLAEAVRNGRREEFGHFEGFSGDLPDPMDPATRDSARPYADLPPDSDDWRRLTARLVGWRAIQVSPLLRSGSAGPAQVRATGPKSLVAVWPFGAGTLGMAFQLGTKPETPHLWPDTADRVTLGTATGPFGFCAWTQRR